MTRRRKRAGTRPGAPARAQPQRVRQVSAPAPQTRAVPSARLIGLIIGLTVLAGAAAFLLAYANRPSGQAAGEVPDRTVTHSCDRVLAADEATGSDGATPGILGQEHVAAGARVSYGYCPPTSGRHYAAQNAGPVRPGFYGPDSPVGPGGWVHNLEHGYLVALYRCEPGGCPSGQTLQTLQGLLRSVPTTQVAAACGYRSKVVVARFDELEAPFALLTWGRVRYLTTLDSSVVTSFAERWVEREAPEPRAC